MALDVSSLLLRLLRLFLLLHLIVSKYVPMRLSGVVIGKIAATFCLVHQERRKSAPSRNVVDCQASNGALLSFVNLQLLPDTT